MFCTRCGVQNDDVARFCRNCSQPLTRTGAAPPTPGQRPPTSDAPYPGYQGGQNPGFQSQHPVGSQPPFHQNVPANYPQQYGANYQPVPQPYRSSVIQLPPGSHSIAIAVILSLCCITGFGQIYNKQAMKGIAILLASILFGVFSGGISFLITWPLSVIDAYLIATKLNRGQAVGEWEWF